MGPRAAAVRSAWSARRAQGSAQRRSARSRSARSAAGPPNSGGQMRHAPTNAPIAASAIRVASRVRPEAQRRASRRQIRAPSAAAAAAWAGPSASRNVPAGSVVLQPERCAGSSTTQKVTASAAATVASPATANSTAARSGGRAGVSSKAFGVVGRDARPGSVRYSNGIALPRSVSRQKRRRSARPCVLERDTAARLPCGGSIPRAVPTPTGAKWGELPIGRVAKRA